MLLLGRRFVHRANAAGLDSCHPIIPHVAKPWARQGKLSVAKAKATWLDAVAEPTADCVAT